MKPFVVLIAGPSCGGKSTVAHAVHAVAPKGGCVVVPLDRYYRDLSHLDPAERAKANFDHPDAIDWPLLKAQLADLADGRRIAMPEYDFARHVRGAKSELTASAPMVVAEGILSLHDEDLVAMAGLRVFVDAPDTVCLARRIARDVAERGRSEASVREQFAATVQPMIREFVRPSARHADLVLDGQAPVETLVRAVTDRIAAARS